MKKTRFILATFILAILIFPISVLAFETKKGESIYIAEDEIVEGNLYAAGTSITVDGKVHGDIYCAGQSIIINGEVAGDVICAGRAITIDGIVNGSVRLAGQSIIIKNEVKQNVLAFGSDIILDKNAKVGWEMLVAGAIANINGKINGTFHGAAEKLLIAGEIGEDVRVSTSDNRDQGGLSIKDSAKIDGDVIYTDFLTGTISDKALILGEVVHKLPENKYQKTSGEKFLGYIWGIIFSVFSAIAIGLVVISLWKKPTQKIMDRLLREPGRSIGWGAILMILTPIISVLLMITFVGIKLALLLLGVWIIAMCVGGIFVSTLVGRSIIEKLFKKKSNSLIWALVLGTAVTKFVFSVPLFGWLLALIAIWWGLGGIFLYTKKA